MGLANAQKANRVGVEFRSAIPYFLFAIRG
jgi:hypothetical protein